MKKIKLLALLVCMVSLSYSQEKQLNVGVNAGITIGDIEPQSSIAFGADANYLFDWHEDFLVGPSIGFTYFLPKEVDGVKPDAKLYLPIAASFRFQSFEDAFYVGGDFGYAVGLSPSGNKGGFYIKPMVGYNISENFKIDLFYSGIKKSREADGYIGLGLSYNIFGESGSGYYSY